MKKLIFAFIIAFFTVFNVWAQSPNAFNYQAVVRDASGVVTSNQTVNFRISILKTSTSGTTVYSESHSATTNDFGLANLKIGEGTLLSGNMATIDWGNDDYFVQVELDATGGANYQMMGTSQLLSVPFAMYAKNSGDKVWDKVGNNAEYTNGNIGVGTSATGYAMTAKTVAGNALLKGINQYGDDMMVVNTLNTHPYLHLYDHTGSTEVVALNTNGDSYFDGGNLGLGTNNPEHLLDMEVDAVLGSEKALEVQSSDAATDRFYIRNGTSVSGRFIPSLVGEVNSSTDIPSMFLIATTMWNNDIGTRPLMIFDSRRISTSGAFAPATGIINRPLFEWSSNAVPKMTMAANGNLGIGTTAPARKLHVTEAMRLQPTASAPANPSAGDMYFSSVTSKLMVYDGTTWQACW